MEAVILCGVQGSGKTTLYRDRFLETHARISMDLLRTRAREAAFLRTCLDTRMPFVVDNTNPTVAERARYVEPARAAGFKLVAYLVEADHAVAAGRNAARERTVPAAGLRDVARRLVRPTPEEGFDELWHATAGARRRLADRAAAHDTAAVLSVASIAASVSSRQLDGGRGRRSRAPAPGRVAPTITDGDVGLMQHPRERELGERDARLVGDRPQRLDRRQRRRRRATA